MHVYLFKMRVTLKRKEKRRRMVRNANLLKKDRARSPDLN